MLLGMVELLTAVGEGDKKPLLDRVLEFSLRVCERYALAQMEQGPT
jgi:hypothetical protein